MNDTNNPKIHVDEEWKSRVQAEKEALAMEEKAAGGGSARPKLPQASFATLLSNFATQALMSLGRIPEPTSGRPIVDLEMARFAIDSIEVIQEKSKGNLDEAEKELLDGTLLDLRMAYLDVSKNPAAVTGEAPPASEGSSRIITP